MDLRAPLHSVPRPADLSSAETALQNKAKLTHDQQLHAHADLERREENFEARMRSLPLSELQNIAGDYGISMQDGRDVLDATGNDFHIQRSTQSLQDMNPANLSEKPLAEEMQSPTTRIDLRHLPPRG